MKDSDKIIFHLCADIGSDTRPYKNAGYHVICIGKKYGVENFNAGEMGFVNNTYGVIANPVCTEFSIATGFHKHNDYEKGMFLVNHCMRIIEELGKDKLKFWVIENPASGHLKDFLGKPNYVYEPWWYGDPWTKKTALWGKFNIPPKIYTKWEDVPKNPKLYIRPNRQKPSLAFMHKSAIKNIPEFACFTVDSDMEFRSLNSQKFAQAFLEANK